MATKVKGGAIKEGSIPLSALSDEVKDKIENAGGGADWNAQEDEAGYIENKTHYHDNNVKFKYNEYDDLYETDYVSSDEGPLYIEDVYDFNRKYEIPSIETSDDGQSGYDWSNALTIKFWDASEEYYGVFSVGYNIDNNKVVAIYNANEADVNYDSRIKNMNIFNVVQLESEFIPNTVVKTTPQELSDADKNQALSNLGIDYILKPSEIPQKPIVVLPPYVGEDYQYLNIPWNEIGFTEKHLGLLLKGISLGLITKDNIHEYFYPVDYIADYRVSEYEFNNNYIKFHVYDESQELGGDFVIRFDSKTIDMPLWE